MENANATHVERRVVAWERDRYTAYGWHQYPYRWGADIDRTIADARRYTPETPFVPIGPVPPYYMQTYGYYLTVQEREAYTHLHLVTTTVDGDEVERRYFADETERDQYYYGNAMGDTFAPLNAYRTRYVRKTVGGEPHRVSGRTCAFVPGEHARLDVIRPDGTTATEMIRYADTWDVFVRMRDKTANAGATIVVTAIDQWEREEVVHRETVPSILQIHMSDALTTALEKWIGRDDQVSYHLFHDSTRANVDYLDLDDNGLISYLPGDKALIVNASDGDGFTAKGRQAGKPARIAAKALRFPDRCSSGEYESFANLVKARAEYKPGSIEIVRGDDIRHWYNFSNYSRENGGYTLMNSCMRYTGCSGYFGIYTENPKQVGMAIMLDESEKLIGRAIVWETDEGTAMDRVYGDDMVMTIFGQYARDHGMLQPYGRGTELTVSLEHTEFREYPYMDTFVFLDTKDGKLHSSGINGYTHVLNSTDGGPDAVDEDTVECGSCGHVVDEDDAYYEDNEYYCPTCYERIFTSCDICGDSTRRDDLTTVGNYESCNSCVERYAVTCESCDELVHHRDTHETEDRHTLCSSCYADANTCEGCGYVYYRETGIVSDYNWYCDGCAASLTTSEEEQLALELEVA